MLGMKRKEQMKRGMILIAIGLIIVVARILLEVIFGI
jgi:hypothetical protein